MMDPIQESLWTEKPYLSTQYLLSMDPGIGDNENLSFIFKLYFLRIIFWKSDLETLCFFHCQGTGFINLAILPFGTRWFFFGVGGILRLAGF